MVLGSRLLAGQILVNQLQGFLQIAIAARGGDAQGELPTGPQEVVQFRSPLAVHELLQQGTGQVQAAMSQIEIGDDAEGFGVVLSNLEGLLIFQLGRTGFVKVFVPLRARRRGACLGGSLTVASFKTSRALPA